MLIISSWSEQFRADIGLKGVSQVWGGPPAWYIWLAEAPGVYHLELIEAEEENQNGKDLCKAVFVVKCYPFPGTDTFQTFSFIEQKLIKSNFFDETHTPVFEYREKIPPDLFNVAMLEVTTDHEAHMAGFCIETLDILRSRYAGQTNQTFPVVGLTQQFAEGEVDREIPGLEIAYPLFDCLMCMYANSEKQAPLQLQCSETPGFEVVIDRGKVDTKPNKAVRGYRLVVLYAPLNHNARKKNIGPLKIESSESKQKIVYERMFPCGHFHNDEAEGNLPITVNTKWWSLAHGQYTSELASSCGCH